MLLISPSISLPSNAVSVCLTVQCLCTVMLSQAVQSVEFASYAQVCSDEQHGLHLRSWFMSALNFGQISHPN